jgi:hypothetical protein
MPLVEQELPTLPEHMDSPMVLVVRVTRSLVLCVCFVDRFLSFCTFSFGHCVVYFLRYADSNYPFCIFKFFLHYILLDIWYTFIYIVLSLRCDNYNAASVVRRFRYRHYLVIHLLNFANVLMVWIFLI